MRRVSQFDRRIDPDEYAKETRERFEDWGRRQALKEFTAFMRALNPDYTHETIMESLERKRIK